MRLPSFSNLVAFDAVARRGTLSRAAEELNVSQPAISRRLAALEADIGKTLFDRRTKPLTLTAEGAELFEVLRSSLRRLEGVISRLRGAQDSNTVTISASTSELFNVAVRSPSAATNTQANVPGMSPK